MIRSLLILFVVLIPFMNPFGEVANGQTILSDNAPLTLNVAAGKWRYVAVDAKDWHGEFELDGEALAGNPNIYVRIRYLPNLRFHQFSSTNKKGNEHIEITQSSRLKLDSRRYIIGVYAAGGLDASCRLTGQRKSVPSDHGGMGANRYSQGASFRVWAPFATSVRVAGEFNDWDPVAAQMQPEGNGHWSLDHRGANPGQRYLYVIENDGVVYWKTDPREQRITNSVGESVVYYNEFKWSDGDFQMPSWNEIVLYEMHIGTFNDEPGGRPGTFNEAVDRLDQLKDLGVNAITLMPIVEFPGDFSWGYNPSHPYAVEEVYGGPDALKHFVNEAHDRGIAVLLDVVHNHWGPTDMDLWQFDGWSENDRGGIYFYQDDRANTQWGDTRPDFGRGEVRSYIRDNIMMWLEDFHIDGLRWDSVHSTRTTDLGDNPDGWSLMQWINNEIDASQPWKLSIGEDLRNNDFVTKDTGAGGAGFDSQWDAQFVHPIRGAVQAINDNDRDMFAVRDAIGHNYNGDAFQRVVYSESHDEVANGRSRVPEEITPGDAGSWFARKRSTLAAALVMTSPGIPMIFQGQEVLEDGYFQDTDPVDWSRAETYAGIQLMYRDMIRLRRNWFDQTRGLRGQSTNVFHVNNTDKLVAFHRWDQGGAGDDVIVVCNFRDQQFDDYRIGLPRNGLWKVRFNSDWEGYSDDFGDLFSPDVTGESIAWDGLSFSGKLKIAPYSVLILSQDVAGKSGAIKVPAIKKRVPAVKSATGMVPGSGKIAPIVK